MSTPSFGQIWSFSYDLDNSTFFSGAQFWSVMLCLPCISENQFRWGEENISSHQAFTPIRISFGCSKAISDHHAFFHQMNELDVRNQSRKSAGNAFDTSFVNQWRTSFASVNTTRNVGENPSSMIRWFLDFSRPRAQFECWVWIWLVCFHQFDWEEKVTIEISLAHILRYHQKECLNNNRQAQPSTCFRHSRAHFLPSLLFPTCSSKEIDVYVCAALAY